MSSNEEKRNALVLVTGAGASRELGANNTKLPLMGEWSDALVEKLWSKGPPMLDMTGLKRELTGPQFEATLGKYLEARQAFPRIEDVLKATMKAQYANPALNNAATALPDWYANVLSWLQQIDQTINESLYDMFAEQEIDTTRATTAYDDLLRELGIVRGSRWAYATTNYDPIGEIALQELGYVVHWGEQVRARPGFSPLDVDGLVAGIDAFVPALHLHGRIGWFLRDGDGVAYASNAPKYNPGFGAPIIMLPDPDKEYTSLRVVDLLWRQFEQVLRDARIVVVLGHSLNDPYLVSTLRACVTPLHRLAVTVLGHENRPNQPADEHDPVFAIRDEQLPGAWVIPVRFGDRDNVHAGGFSDWLQRVNASLTS